MQYLRGKNQYMVINLETMLHVEVQMPVKSPIVDTQQEGDGTVFSRGF